MHLLLREVTPKTEEVTTWKINVAPIKITQASWPLPHSRSEVGVNSVPHILVLGLPNRPGFNPENEVFAAKGIDLHVKVLCVGISI